MKEDRPSEALLRAVFKRVVGQGAVGGAVVAIHAQLIGPVTPGLPQWVDEILTLALYVAIMVVVVPLAWVRGRRLFLPLISWVDEDREPTDDERRLLLQLPMRMVTWAARYWALLVLITAGVGLTSSVAPVRAAILNGAAVV